MPFLLAEKSDGARWWVHKTPNEKGEAAASSFIVRQFSWPMNQIVGVLQVAVGEERWPAMEIDGAYSGARAAL